VKTRKRFAQHFLEAPWVERVIDAADPRPADAFVEIGPGQGALTLPLARRAAAVVAVEVDRDLAARLAGRIPENVRVVPADALGVDLAQLFSEFPPTARRRIIGNLPYNVATPILGTLLAAQTRGVRLHDATLMVQREVADRLAASPGGRDYGVLTILTQVHARVSRLLDLPPGAFRPVPKVHSTLVRLMFDGPKVAPALAEVFGKLVRTIFTQRRKILANALKPLAASTGVPVATALASADLDGRRRPETLQLEELQRLASVFASADDPPVL
jgi:16S rRNA (adenine1518-N6/adenine1519-N6)-dimethyltransferase